MKKHVITTTQLRGMIKEALEESMQEIALDEQITALRAKGSKRTLQETKQYRRLLEMKMEVMDEEQLSLPGMEGEESSEPLVSGLQPHVEKALAALEDLPSKSAVVLGRVDKMTEQYQFLAGQAAEMSPNNKKVAVGLLLKAASWLNTHMKDTELTSTEEEAEILGMRKPVMESRRLVRRSR